MSNAKQFFFELFHPSQDNRIPFEVELPQFSLKEKANHWKTADLLGNKKLQEFWAHVYGKLLKKEPESEPRIKSFFTPAV